MLLSITTTHQPATDLGFLLHKNPERVHSSEVSLGQAHVVYPEVGTDRCTAVLLVGVDPIGLVRNRKGRCAPTADCETCSSTSSCSCRPRRRQALLGGPRGDRQTDEAAAKQSYWT